MKKRYYLVEISIDGSNIEFGLKCTGCYAVDWIFLVQDRDQWSAVVKTVTKFREKENSENISYLHSRLCR